MSRVCSGTAPLPITGGVVVTKEIISVWWFRIQGAVPVVISGVEKMLGFR
ncbi:hypothetical protein HanHA300_Chr10g0370701 [Helianthus annuus]|nr:hypothetical protein HanHA300_Chr10g0370701 [Helianthus annuus]